MNTSLKSQFHKSLIDNLYDGVYFVDKDRLITYWNKGAERITGYEAEDSFELYDLSENIEELHDLYPDQPAFAKQMKEELLEAFFEANKK